MDMIKFDEMKKLMFGLYDKGIDFNLKVFFDGISITINDENGNYLWDAICHRGSYGHEEGLIEVMGIVSDYEDDVEGYLTAEEILSRL